MSNNFKEKTNAATRVYLILSSAAGKNPNTSTIDVWTDVFGVEGGRQAERNMAVTDSLNALTREFHSAQAKMQESGFYGDLWNPYFSRIEKALQMDNLSTNWNDKKKYLDEATLLSLQWCASVLPDDNGLVEEELLSEIETNLDTIKNLLHEKTFPDDLRTFIERQVQIIETALRKYKIMGERAFRDAFFEGYSEVIDHPETIDEYGADETVSRLGEIWKAIKKVPTAAIAVNRTLQAGEGISSRVAGFLENFGVSGGGV
ncbi:hypothetical protein [Arhodomonas sp. SL1]|uniref:hypothetical protein n=1 Tax=Arhodomonas sp. SL1 TaxID=3425691 RepID=UPI003F8836EB